MKSFQFRLFLLFFCSVGTLMILQFAFDSSDHRKSEKAVRNYSVGGKQFGPFLEARAPGGVWSTEITHGCRGVVRTRYSAPGGLYELDYDVPAHAIHPGNELGRTALESFTAAAPTAVVDGGAAHD